MSEEKTRMKRIIENGKIKYARVPISLEDELEERNKEISRLKKLVDELRSKLEVYEQAEQRQKLIEAGPASSYAMYD